MKRGLVLLMGLFVVSLAYAAVPVVTSIDLATTYGFNTTAENITIELDVTDGDLDLLKNITNWYVDGISTTALRFPFESGSVNGSAVGVANGTQDYSGYNGSHTIYNLTYLNTGGYDGRGAYRVLGPGNYIDTPSFDLGQEFSAEFWINVTSSTNWDTVMNFFSWNGFTFHLWENEGRVSAGYRPGGVECRFGDESIVIGAFTYGDWHHFVYTKDASGQRLYLNGVLEANRSNCGLHNWTTTNFRIGSINYNPDYILDDVVIYNHSISAEQVSAHYASNRDTIIFGETSVGENWQACVTPNDGTSDGAEECSKNLSITAVEQTIGNETNVSVSGVSDLNITVDGSDNLSVHDFDSHVVAFYDGFDLIANFSQDFSQSKLDFSQVSIVKSEIGILVNLNGQLAGTKTLYMGNQGVPQVCVKDAEISSLGEITAGCTGTNETFFTSVECASVTTRNGITCDLSGGVYSFSNLTASGATGTGAVPEFHEWALMILLTVALMGIVVIRRK